MVRWQSLLSGYYKLNVGDVMELQDGARGVGVVVCDSCGDLSGAVRGGATLGPIPSKAQGGVSNCPFTQLVVVHPRGSHTHEILASSLGVVAMRALGLVSVLATKLYTTKTGLSFALDASFESLLLVSNSIQAVKLVNSNDECFVEEGGLVDEIRR
ncbi:PREDICTED: F-box/LRR-repeat At4g00320 [Prunus dulcis]|uniref:PREDICTED: F-box/LRR-repeat At4g00320 n=1 Tax=Prunus dulcis TaxID=3755 RepID=A0A5E4G2X9_PRUDU|nr:PREDICTED: F-box/LRR-repeat At4g00320 [Prunus dulcis]